ncbi:hypothetical protein LWI28_019511 [Acer negundo]|uniref:non-specific serine/threonine protein kinase n=1 Tax=Acer negundo TaxID=4023 RepID=A0AAD5JTQ9_ACENE|nr:hypothetical protein LWI28_019511 [Acer negundo]
MMMAIWRWKSFLELFIFLYFAYLQLAAVAQYDDYPSAKLSSSWTNNDLSAINITDHDNSDVTMRIILLNVPDPSSEIGFACGFVYNLSTDSSFLASASVSLVTDSYNNYIWSGVEVYWLANRNKPVHENATLELHTNGDLILRDADGSFVWSTNTSHMSVAGLQMLNTGNLVLFNDNNKTIWQSFDHPTDTLLPGQKQMVGQKPEIKGIYPQADPSEATMQITLLNSITGFAFGFVYNHSIGSNFLGVALVWKQPFYTGGQSYWSVVEVYWLANRNKPVQENATLELHTNGDLILRDADGSFVWSTNTSHMSVAGLKMLQTGNLLLFDDNNKTIWQSFDHPTNTLLPGQKLMAGQKLVSRASETDWTEGSFYLSVSSEGLFAFYRSTVPQMYFKFSVSGIKESEQPSYIRAVDGTLALYILSAEPSEPDAVLSSPVGYKENAYMRLDSDGHLRFYDVGMDPVDILAGDLEECGYPTVCGNYGLCSEGKCSCPYGFDRNNVSGNQSNFGCTRINPLTCENGQSQSLNLLKGIYYFNYVDPDAADLKGIHMDSCKDACLRNCSCKVAMFRFYHNTSHGNCFLLSNVLSLIEGQRRSSYHSNAFLKLPSDQKFQRSAPPTRAIAGVTVGTFALVVLLVGFCIFCLRKKRNTDGDVEDYLKDISGMPTRFPYEELKLATEDFRRKLGKGGFGSVFEGTLVSGEKVAAKRLDSLGQGKKEFLAEVKTIGSIHHINLVRLVGFCAEKLHRLLVYEFMCNGSLDKWIFNRIPQQPALDWKTRKTIILDIAKGLAYLHEECRHRIVHLDIKPQNILLDVNLRAKISDFGLSKLIDKDQSQVVTTMRGTPGYFAPELLSSIVTEKADVYSFGIVVMEVVCGRKNLDRSQSEGCIHLLPFFRIKAEEDCLIDLVDKNSEDMQLHGEEVVQMMRVAVWCLQNDYNRRPSMSTVVKVLEGTMEFEAALIATTTEAEEQFGDTTSSLQPSILSGPRTESDGQLSVIPVTNHALKWVPHRFRSTPSCATTAFEAFNSVGLRKTGGDLGMIMADEAALVASMPIQWTKIKIVGGDRLLSLTTVTITITRRLATHRRACSTAGHPKPFPDLFLKVREGLKEINLGIFVVNPEKLREEEIVGLIVTSWVGSETMLGRVRREVLSILTNWTHLQLSNSCGVLGDQNEVLNKLVSNTVGPSQEWAVLAST